MLGKGFVLEKTIAMNTILPKKKPMWINIY